MYAGDTLSLRRGWEATLQVVDVLSREGVGILVGTDFGQPFIFPGTSVHEETPLQALQAATFIPRATSASLIY